MVSQLSQPLSPNYFYIIQVVPELREWCEEKSIQLIECDLRWGVPKDSTTEATIRTCLGELDRCSEETDGEPFFLNMLGERCLLMIKMCFCFDIQGFRGTLRRGDFCPLLQITNMLIKLFHHHHYQISST